MTRSRRPGHRLLVWVAPAASGSKLSGHFDPAFAGDVLKEAVECLLKNEVVPAQLLLRDITNCTIGFQSLARETGIMEKSLMRMLSVRGNPQAKNLFHVIEVLQRLNQLKLEVRAV